MKYVARRSTCSMTATVAAVLFCLAVALGSPVSWAAESADAGAATTAKVSESDRVEARIKDLHSKLKITESQEEQWNKVAQVMRENAAEMAPLVQARREQRNTLNAVEDLKSYSRITEAHAAGLNRFIPVFEALYASMTDDQKKIADTVFGGEVLPIYSMVPPGFLGASEAFDAMYASPDLDKAKESLAASGYTESNPLELEMWYPPEHYGTQTAAWMEVIKKQLEATGAIKVTLQAQEWSTYVTACTGGDAYAACVLGWFYDYPDASNYMEPFIYNGGQGSNISPSKEGTQYGEPINDKAKQLVDLMAQSDVETDLTKRADLLKQAQDIYADLVVTLPLFLNPEYVVFRDNIKASDQYPSPETLNIGGTIEFNYSTLSKTP